MLMQHRLLRLLAIAMVGSSIGALASQPAQAGQLFDINAQGTGFVTALSGASEFGNSDGRPGSLPGCMLCDSVVNFATYANPGMADWTAALGLTPTGVGTVSPGMMAGVDTTAKWVFFYQIQNTNPLGGTNAILQNFNVTKEGSDGLPFDVQPYTSAGYVDGMGLSNFNATPGLDAPNDWHPTEEGVAKDPIISGGGTAPTSAFGTLLGGPSPIVSLSVRAGAVPYTGALFEFAGPGIAADAFTDVLFLTSNDQFAGFVWAETESPGGFGAAGDVAGIKNPVPEPSTMVIWSLIGVAGVVCARRRKNKSNSV